MEKILVLGSSGLVGRALCKQLSNEYSVLGTFNSREFHCDNVEFIKFDIEEIEKLNEILISQSPSKIIISLTGDFENQMKVIERIANYSSETNALVYFVSTWNVFDKTPNRIYYEDDCMKSGTDYGKFKIDAEDVLSKAIKDNLIVFRLPMVWGKNSPRLNQLKERLINNETIEVVNNLFLNSNTDEMISKQMHHVIKNDLRGIFHLGAVDMINHVDFIKQLVGKLGYSDASYNEISYGDEEYVALLGTRNSWPNELKICSNDVINTLI